ncbi:MAG: hypothetical protein KBG04_05910, partial [Bacteroidales bacterium]|nr:hypothetical protein [Bacteroidales bacterium]
MSTVIAVGEAFKSVLNFLTTASFFGSSILIYLSILSALLLLAFFSIAPAQQVNIQPGLLKFTVIGTIDGKNNGMI